MIGKAHGQIRGLHLDPQLREGEAGGRSQLRIQKEEKEGEAGEVWRKGKEGKKKQGREGGGCEGPPS